MSSEQDYLLGEMDRRLGNIVREGTVVAADFSAPAAPRVRVNLGDFTTGWLPWLAGRAGHTRVWAPPDIGEQVAVLSNGEPSQGIVLPGGMFQDAFQANGNAAKDTRVTFKDGTVVEFDREAGALRVVVNPAGNVLVQIGATQLSMQDGQATLKAANINLQGDVSITGGTLKHEGKDVGRTHAHMEQGDGQPTSAPI